ncbi:hypothetical protein CLIB1423_01S11848 [[Candida] railenensis]|uniref:Uncharacterized protein n=1 Tax=[Candida] railenensis TaxID=45579 RepID=A0A9P0QKU9_9ASCO|nr:hypothetical protein CLIB1423_01S11848 [[Candida] railenensis]
MAAEGLEKITEVPVEFFKDGSAFIKKCQKPDQKGTYIWIFVSQGQNEIKDLSDLRECILYGNVTIRMLCVIKGRAYKINSLTCTLESFLWSALGMTALTYSLGLQFSYFYFSFSF